MQVVIDGIERLTAGHYGAYAHVDSDGTLHIVVDPERSPEDSAYTVTKGAFV